MGKLRALKSRADHPNSHPNPKPHPTPYPIPCIYPKPNPDQDSIVSLNFELEKLRAQYAKDLKVNIGHAVLIKQGVT